jgi:hypothetical protein
MVGRSTPVTPDGRYFVVGGRHGAWPIRISIEAFAHKAVDVAKRALGERGPVLVA